ncbi:MAG: Rpp14/Pop5 family protein [Deltaproteobacteria bacterium]
MLQRRDKRRYILVYVNDQICIGSSQLINDSADTFYYNTNSQIFSNNKDNLLSNSQERYKNNNIRIPKKNRKHNYHNYDTTHSSKIIKKRFSELFGSIEFEKASINIIYKQNFSLRNCFIIRCNAKSVDKVLFALSCCYPPLTTIKISGTLKKLISSIEILKA